MSNITENNVDDYKTEHECDEHWELRRKFLLTHQDKFPIDELKCLAQVFTNVEFLGCRYPKETMQMISELSKEVVQDYREKQKNRLQRTFVGASDAANSKAKGRSRGDKFSDSPNSSFGEPSKNKFQPLYSNFKRKQDQNFSESYSDVKKKKFNAQSTEYVLIEYTNDTPTGMLSRLANSNDTEIEWKFDRSGSQFTCTVFLNGRKLGQAKADSQKEAKKEASAVALTDLQKRYYTIKVTKNLTPTISGNLGEESTSQKNSESIGNDNIGMKMMKMMGWSGGGLGKTSQGITEPVSLQQQMTREGLGLKPGMYNKQFFQKKCKEVLHNYIRGDTSVDLVFTPSFSNEERAMIHQIAKQLGLKSQSYGPKTSRTLTISRKIQPKELVNELLELGGSTEKYQLIEPTDN